MDTPYVSHFASARGNTGKSTARMARIVINIMCALYVVSAGSGAITLFPCPGFEFSDACRGLSGIGEDGRPVDDGRGVPDSRRGNRRRRLMGNRSMNIRGPGFTANKVIERRRGATRTIVSVRKCRVLDAGRRDFSAECNAIDAFICPFRVNYRV